ncbi:putative transcriptional regulator [Caldicellulosiruptor bescii]|uniref:Transcriptional repressor, CopY family n=2 Tax=Caldicellulosiruptor bescii TaxID=31899 RepID=B9MS00_CALBD|nr:BlaI/MecI/CopY family transcriptional regulator [Caldicellulosiruptor bescii]ACM60454.1 transcriptional repressor, CopY family [Caldicellulosiruptor bescii DSM 6725]PBC87868.1 putative transcriptional regulator [Caldicellulosiruptor bescii]PBC90800.1 putative transcriptional regulator [Caldicellulosiruptor bescii]PBD03767.1 putative transcriptional regulator [Caldicellulosiruptor bescii]PBD06598.1 putative transcriptional regulator [Caldicellulosiruptor bescii]
MNKDLLKPSEAELEVMKVLWEEGKALSAPEIVQKLKEKHIKWEKSTIYTLIDRLVKKKAIKQEKKNKLYYYSPSISKEEYAKIETARVLNKLFNGSVKDLIAALVESGNLKKEELEEIKKLLGKEE